MLDTAKSLKGYRLQATDGPLGEVQEFYFDDKHWAVRYLVLDTGDWLSSRKVLISPYALTNVDHQGRSISACLTKKQVEESPSPDTAKPVSKQFEENYNAYYGWPAYWNGLSMWGAYSYVMLPRPGEHPVVGGRHDAWDPHLRSTRHVAGFSVVANDGEIGHVDDFVIDDGSWAIRYLVVATHNWWPGKKVLISPQWIKSVNWDHMGSLKIDLKREAIRSSPAYSEQALLTRDHESALHRHYERPGYWAEEKSAASMPRP
jgi:uncharacterized protein YrrD